jgi:hypothetical protein
MPGVAEIELKYAANRKFDLIEQKIDGSRHTYQSGKLVSDRGINRAIDRFPHIAKELAALNIHCRGEVAIPDGNVLQLNSGLNWKHAKYYIFDLYSFGGLDFTKAGTLLQRQALEQIMLSKNLSHILIPPKFASVDEGWAHITQNNLEGLVMKMDNGQIYKTKFMKEAKVKITGHEQGSTKGAFIVDWNGVECRVSGTSMDYIQRAYNMIAQGQTPYLEIEYLFKTDDGHPFQPRIRRIGTLEQLS